MPKVSIIKNPDYTADTSKLAPLKIAQLRYINSEPELLECLLRFNATEGRLPTSRDKEGAPTGKQWITIMDQLSYKDNMKFSDFLRRHGYVAISAKLSSPKTKKTNGATPVTDLFTRANVEEAVRLHKFNEKSLPCSFELPIQYGILKGQKWSALRDRGDSGNIKGLPEGTTLLVLMREMGYEDKAARKPKLNLTNAYNTLAFYADLNKAIPNHDDLVQHGALFGERWGAIVDYVEKVTQRPVAVFENVVKSRRALKNDKAPSIQDIRAASPDFAHPV